MKRYVLLLITLALLAAPRAAEAQPVGKVYRLGTRMTTPDVLPSEIDRRYTEGRRERLPALAAELVALNPDVMLVTTGYQAAALKHATTAIPIVAIGGDLVAEGLAASPARPGGNVTGLQLLQPDAAAKRVSLLKEAMPRISKVGSSSGR